MNERQQALELFSRNALAVGVVTEADLVRYDLHMVAEEGDVLGAALVEVLDDEYAVVHAIAVDDGARGNGIGSRLGSTLKREVPATTLQAKCRKGLPANEFYKSCGWTLARETGDGNMNVWETR